MKHLDLFSGIGGFALACRMVGGIKTVGFVERDLYCQFVLKKNFSGVPIHSDIKDFNGNEYGAVDLITGGFPCQPYSFAGKQRGSEDDRALWPEMFRVIQTIRPTWIIGENVVGFIKMGLDCTLSDLESEGYTCQSFIIPACGVDAPHQRGRVFFVAYSNGQREPQQTGKQSQCGDGAKFSGETISNPHSEYAHPARYGSGGDFEQGEGGLQRLVHEWGNWPLEPSVGRMAHGIPCRLAQIAGLGNAIVPQVAAEIIAGIKAIGEGRR